MSGLHIVEVCISDLWLVMITVILFESTCLIILYGIVDISFYHLHRIGVYNKVFHFHLWWSCYSNAVFTKDIEMFTWSYYQKKKIMHSHPSFRCDMLDQEQQILILTSRMNSLPTTTQLIKLKTNRLIFCIAVSYVFLLFVVLCIIQVV